MKFKTLLNIGICFVTIGLTSCGDVPTDANTEEITALAQLENEAFQEEVRVLEIRLQNYIKEIDTKIEAEGEAQSEHYTEAKTEAINKLMQLRSDFGEATAESADQWTAFQEQITEFLSASIEEIDYSKDSEEDNMDS